MEDSEKEMYRVSEAVQAGLLPVSCLDSCRKSLKEIHESSRKLALSRIENKYICEARGPSMCWRLLKSLSRCRETLDIPPKELRDHFSKVYSKPGHPALLWYLFRFVRRCLFMKLTLNCSLSESSFSWCFCFSIFLFRFVFVATTPTVTRQWAKFLIIWSKFTMNFPSRLRMKNYAWPYTDSTEKRLLALRGSHHGSSKRFFSWNLLGALYWHWWTHASC